MEALAPKTKAEFYGRWFNGEFGNFPRSWNTLSDFLESDYHGLLSVRSKTPGGPCWYNVDSKEVRKAVFTQSNLAFNESMPDDKLVIQGQAWRDETGLRLEYCCTPNLKFREAIGNPENMRQATRLEAAFLLKQHLDPNSYDDLMELLTQYPDAHIEFSAYSINVGVCPNRGTVIWEVRNY